MDIIHISEIVNTEQLVMSPSSALDITVDFVNPTTWGYKRYYGVQVLDSAGSPVDNAVVGFELIGAPTWMKLDVSSIEVLSRVTGSRDFNPRYDTTTNLNGVAYASLTYTKPASGSANLSPALGGSYTLRAWYKGRHADLTCYFETPYAPTTPLGMVWVRGLGGANLGTGTNNADTRTTVASGAVIDFNCCDVAHCPMGEVPFTVAFTALSGAFNATYATGFGLINPANYADPVGSTLLEAYDATTSAIVNFYSSGVGGEESRANCGNSAKTQGMFSVKIRNKTGGSLNAKLDFSATKNGVTKTMSAYFTVTNAAS